MNPINDGGPAFPALEAGCTRSDAYGMTLRDWFAGHAMQGMLLCEPPNPVPKGCENMTIAEYIAQRAYKMADAMLKAREAK